MVPGEGGEIGAGDLPLGPGELTTLEPSAFEKSEHLRRANAKSFGSLTVRHTRQRFEVSLEAALGPDRGALGALLEIGAARLLLCAHANS